MRTPIDLAKLDLRAAFDFAIMIEEDAQVRYAELARRLGDDPGGAGAVFRRMVPFEARHRRDLLARRTGLFRGEPPRIEISVADGVEGPDADDELPRTARGALAVALAAERRAHDFYRQMIPQAGDAAVRAFFERLMSEEASHADLLAETLASLGGAAEPEEPAAAPAAVDAAPEAFPDRAVLEAALRRFDAATQAIAVAVVVEGRGQAEVAAALGVSRRTVARKLAAFLAVARQGAVGAATAATLMGSAPALPSSQATAQAGLGAVLPASGAAHQTPAAVPRPAPPARVAAPARAVSTPRRPAAATPAELAARIHAQVAARMRARDPSLSETVARAVLSEATRAGLDPLLVLALIHVESSYDPVAVSSAGAVGLMQLLEPTMRREMERMGHPPADPRDPVANVKAGVSYLRRLLGAFRDDLDVALMAYNAGPNRIRRFLKDGGIPERYHVYPQRVKRELERLRVAFAAGPGGAELVASSERKPPPSG